MDESILLSIKQLLGLEQDLTAFDLDVMVHINTMLGVLNQLGIGVTDFAITGIDETWSSFLKDSPVPVNEVKTYVYLRVRQLFDPPTSGIVMNAIDATIQELGWRMTSKVEIEPKLSGGG